MEIYQVVFQCAMERIATRFSKSKVESILDFLCWGQTWVCHWQGDHIKF